MNNLEYSKSDCFLFHKGIVESKKKTKEDPDYKTRVSGLNLDVEKQYHLFEDLFLKNNLQVLVPLGYKGQNKVDLLFLYSYKSKIIQHLKNEITTTETGRIINTCQNCTINAINSFDHVIPKDEFPEFVVNPKNLFPSCTECNNFKSSIWRNGNEKYFLNLYIDKLPDCQYLFVDINLSKGIVGTKFYLNNSCNIDSVLYKLIEFHYTKLQLCKRFSDNNDQVVTSLTNSIKSFLGTISIDTIRKTNLEIIRRNQLAFGSNYWKAILELALLDSEDFMRQFV